MTTPSLDVFSLRDSVVNEYKGFATSFTTIHSHDIREQVEAIYAQQRYWPEPLIQINPSYKRSTDVAALVAAGLLERGSAEIFRADGQGAMKADHSRPRKIGVGCPALWPSEAVCGRLFRNGLQVLASGPRIPASPTSCTSTPDRRARSHASDQRRRRPGAGAEVADGCIDLKPEV
jgi:hypothetical protein